MVQAQQRAAAAEQHAERGERSEQMRRGLAARAVMNRKSTGLKWIDASADANVVRAVLSEQRKAEMARQRLVVYVGAAWCEPCRYFHDAALAGQLDEQLGTLRILAFDLDRDQAKLAAAGYTSEMIPLFAVPGEDGRAAGPQLAGSVKGPEALEFIVPRLKRLLASSEVRPAQLAGSATPTRASGDRR